jgi:hypothetical protein
MELTVATIEAKINEVEAKRQQWLAESQEIVNKQMLYFNGQVDALRSLLPAPEVVEEPVSDS